MTNSFKSCLYNKQATHEIIAVALKRHKNITALLQMLESTKPGY